MSTDGFVASWTWLLVHGARKPFPNRNCLGGEDLVDAVVSVEAVDEAVSLVQPSHRTSAIDSKLERAVIAVQGHDAVQHATTEPTALCPDIEIEVFNPYTVCLTSDGNDSRDLAVDLDDAGVGRDIGVQ